MTAWQRAIAILWGRTSPVPEQKATSGIRTSQLLPAWQSGRPMVWTRWDVVKAIREGYNHNPVVRRCVDIRAHALAALVWVVEERQRDGSWQRAPAHPLGRLLENPNQWMSWQQLIVRASIHLDLAGNALWTKILATDLRADRRVPIELWPLDPCGLKPIPVRTGFIRGYEYQRDGERIEIPAEQVVHVMYVDPASPYWGASPLLGAARATDIYNVVGQWNASLLENDAIPRGVFSFDYPLSREDWELAREELQANYASAANARLPIVLGQGAHWVQTSWKPSELDYIESLKLQREDIAMVFGIPPTELGLLEQATHSNVEELSRRVWTSTILPLADTIAGSLTRSLVPHFGPLGELRIHYDISNISVLREDFGDRVEQLEKLVRSGVPLNEGITLLKLPLNPVKGGDTPLVPATMSSLHDVLTMANEPSLTGKAFTPSAPRPSLVASTPSVEPELYFSEDEAAHSPQMVRGFIQLALPSPRLPKPLEKRVEFVTNSQGVLTGAIVRYEEAEAA